MTDLIILSLLLDGPRYGYDLKKDAAVVLEQKTLHNNLVYPLLARFRRSGWVRRREEPGERGQTRQLYTLTRAGKEEVMRRLRTFSEKDADNSSAFQLRVALFELLDSKTRLEILRAREVSLVNKEARLKKIAKHFEMGKFPHAVVALRRRQVAAELAWLRGLRRIARRAK